MQGIGSTSAVTGGQYLAVSLKDIGNDLGTAVQFGQGRFGVGDCLDKFRVLLLDDGIHEMRGLGARSGPVMKIFFRYLFLRLLVPFAICLFGCTIIWIMVNLYGNIDDFLENKGNLLLILRFYGLQIPSILVTVLPATLLFSTLWTLLSLNRRSELVALQSGGMAPLLLFSPFVCFTVIWVAVLEFDLNWPAPQAQVAGERLLKELKGSKEGRNIFTNLGYVDKVYRRIWFFQKIDTNEGKAEGMEITFRDAKGHDITKYCARQATWNGEFWKLTGVLKITYAINGGVQDQKTYEQIDLPEVTTPPQQLSLIISQPDQLTLNQLSQYIASGTGSTERVAQFRTQWWYRVLYPFTLLVLMLYALLQGVRTDRRGVAAGIVWVIVVLLVYTIMMYVFTAAGQHNRLPPFVAVAATEVIFGTIGLYLLALNNGWGWQLLEYWNGRRGRSVADRDAELED